MDINEDSPPTVVDFWFNRVIVSIMSVFFSLIPGESAAFTFEAQIICISLTKSKMVFSLIKSGVVTSSSSSSSFLFFSA